jgi:CRP-like cAMP-binding protein
VAIEMKQEFERRFPNWAQALGPVNTDVLVKATKLLELPANRVIIRDRMPVDSLYMIMEGEVMISVEENGKSIKLDTVGAGQVLGEVSVLSGELLASSTATSTTPVRLLRLRHQAFEDLISTNYEVASVLLKHFVTMLADRLRTSASSFAELRGEPGSPAVRGAEVSADPGGKNWIKSFFDRAPGA